MRRRPGVAVWVVASIGTAFLGLPVLVLISRAVGGGTLLTALSSPAVIDALVLSLFTTGISLLVVAALGLPLAFLLARARFPGQSLVETIVDLPIVLPPSVAGLALLLFLGRRGVFGDALAGAGVSIAFTTFAVILAQVFVSAPFYVRAAAPASPPWTRPRGRGTRRRRAETPRVPLDHCPLGGARARGRPGDNVGAGARRVRRHDHVRGRDPGVTRRCRSSSTASSSRPIWRRRSPPRPCW